MIIINYLKLYKCLQTNDFDYIERIIWNLIIINITSKYLKPYNFYLFGILENI